MVNTSDIIDGTPYNPEHFVLNCRGRELDCRPFQSHGAGVMGILNVTPDSFSDGGRYLEREDALRRTEAMLEAGADIIDVGGESTRPAGSVYGEGAPQVEADEERRRILPVIEAITDRFPEVIISVDTYKPIVARDALEAGASIVNDVTGLRRGSELAEVAAAHDAPVVVMHSVGEPGELTHASEYTNVVAEVKESLRRSVATAEAAGVNDIIVDAGFGFGKSVEDNLRLMGASTEFLALDRPVLVGISRKSTVGAVLGSSEHPRPVDERLFGSLGVTAVAVLRGASIVRTHDVRATSDMLRTLGATVSSYKPTEDLP